MQTWKIVLIVISGLLVLGGSTWAIVHFTMKPKSVSSYTPSQISDFRTWQRRFNIKQSSNPDDEAYELETFTNNLNMINEHNKVKNTYSLGQNQFMSTPKKEFIEKYLGLKSQYGYRTGAPQKHTSTRSAPSSVDWRTKNDVSAIKNQGQCGSCWAFSTTGSLESDDAIFGSGLGDFSEQQLVDCSAAEGNQGCNGGLMDYAFQYVMKNGITTESNYPYTAATGTCNQSAASKTAFKITSYKDISAGDCDGLKTAVAQQPTSIGVDAETWQFYSGGVFSNCGTQLDHGVLAVGYSGTDYWIVKNSWGSSWGEQGYIRLKDGNTCGICNTASYPVK